MRTNGSAGLVALPTPVRKNPAGVTRSSSTSRVRAGRRAGRRSSRRGERYCQDWFMDSLLLCRQRRRRRTAPAPEVGERSLEGREGSGVKEGWEGRGRGKGCAARCHRHLRRNPPLGGTGGCHGPVAVGG